MPRSDKDTRQKAKHWCFTIYPPALPGQEATPEAIKESRDLVESWYADKKLIYYYYQLERCPNTGRLHLQGFCGFTQRLRLSEIKRLYHPTAHFEVRRGRVEDNEVYCSKDDSKVDGPWQKGNLPLGAPPDQGKRSDVLALRDEIVKGATIPALILGDHFGLVFRNFGNLQKIRQYLLKPRSTWTRLIVLYGDSGSGKSTAAFQLFGDTFAPTLGSSTNEKGEPMLWFDGYDGLSVSTVVFDEFRPNWMYFTSFLRYSDQHPYKVSIKGSTTEYTATTLVVTTRNPPEDWYPKVYAKGEYDQLWRRIDESKGAVIKFEKHNGVVTKTLERGTWPPEMRPSSPDNSHHESDDE